MAACQGCEWALSGLFSCCFLPLPLPAAESSPCCISGEGTTPGKVFSLSTCPLRPCPAGMLREPAPALSEDSKDANTPCLLRQSQQPGTAGMRPDALSSGHCALADRGQQEFSGSKSWTGMQQKADACWNNSSSSSLVYFV